MLSLGCVEIVEAIGGRPERRVQITGVSTDSRGTQPGDLFFALKGERFDGHDFVRDAFSRGAAAAVVSRPVAGLEPHHYCIMVPDTIRALGDLARFCRRRWGGTVIAITGSNGKTTTKDMVHHILAGERRARKAQHSFNNHIGVPLTIFALEADDKYAVLEMGTSAPGEIARLAEIAEPDVGVVTNVAPTHLQDLGSVRGVAVEKGALVAALRAEGMAVLNGDNVWCRRMARDCRARVVTFGFGRGATTRVVALEWLEWGTRFRTKDGAVFELVVPGRHNVLNALAAIAVGRELGLTDAEMAERLRTFELPPMRLARRDVGGITLINDAYNANPASMEAALDVYAALPVRGRRFVVFGDMLELGRRSRRLHEDLGARVAQARLDGLWTVGEESRWTAVAARAHNPALRVQEARHLEEAAIQILSVLMPGDAVLIKGSRRMNLDRLLDLLVAGLAAGEGVEAMVQPEAAGKRCDPNGQEGQRCSTSG